MSVTSTRLLLISHSCYDDDPRKLLQLDEVGNELRRVQLPYYMRPYHAVESPTDTFIVSHSNKQLHQYQVSEVNTGGEVLRHFSVSRLPPSVYQPPRIAVDSQGNIFVADKRNSRILLLIAQLKLRRVIIDKDQIKDEEAQHLSYREQSGQLLVGCRHRVIVFDVLHH